jgi:hypothetical protein
MILDPHGIMLSKKLYISKRIADHVTKNLTCQRVDTLTHTTIVFEHGGRVYEIQLIRNGSGAFKGALKACRVYYKTKYSDIIIVPASKLRELSISLGC